MKEQHSLIASRDAGERAAQVLQVFFFQQGSSNTLRVTDENAWYVVCEVLSGNHRLLSTSVVSRHASRDEAMAECERLRREQAFSDVMTVAEVAAEYGLSVEAVRKAIYDGRIISRRSGGTHLIHRASVEELWGKRRQLLEAAREWIKEVGE